VLVSLFNRRRDEPQDPQAVIDQLAAQSGGTPPGYPAQVPPGYGGPVTAGGQPGIAPPIEGAMPAQSFQMTVEDVFSIKGRGVVVTGRISAGQVSKGMPIVVYRAMQPVGRMTVNGVEMFRKMQDTAVAGDNVGLLLSASDRSAVQPGDFLADR
jgi:hypothetical protein